MPTLRCLIALLIIGVVVHNLMTVTVVSNSSTPAKSTAVSPSSRIWPIHALLYLVLIIALFASIDFGGSLSSDDGAYGWQIYALENGTWPLERTLPVVATDNEGIVNAYVGPEGPWPYTRHPTYVVAQRAIADKFGLVGGAYAIPLISLLLMPFVVAALVRSIDRSWVVPAFWLAVLSPLAINGVGLWAHAPATVMATLSLWAAIELIKRPNLWGSALLSTSLAINVLLRSEAALWAGALTVAIVIVGRDLSRLLHAAVGLSAAAFAAIAERRITASLTADAFPVGDRPGRSYLSDRILVAWHEIFSGSLYESEIGLLAILGVVSLLFGAFRFRQSRLRDAKMFFAVGLVLYALRLPLIDRDLMSGLVTAWPAPIILLIAVPIRLRSPLRVAAVTGVIFTAAVLITSSGSGHGWGGRYLSSLIPVLCVLGTAAFSQLDRTRMVQGFAIAILTVPLLSGLLGAHKMRTWHASVIERVVEVETDVVVAEAMAMPRLAWATAPSTEWYRSTPERLDPFLADLAAANVERITVQGFSDQPIAIDGYTTVELDDGLRQLVLS